MTWMILALLYSPGAFAYTPGPELIMSPALLVDYPSWIREGEAFSADGSETRVFRDLVEILYDRDIERPWGSEYFPEANRRLDKFRAVVCKAVATLKSCFRPSALMTDDDVKTLEQNLLDPASLAALGARWKMVIEPWSLPLREPSFSLVAGPVSESLEREGAYWNLKPASVSWTLVKEPLLGDEANYLAGFESHDFPALFALEGGGHVALDDWHLRNRSMDFAARWKHAIFANHDVPPKDPVSDNKELQFQRLFDEKAADFARTYAEQLKQVSGVPEVVARFQKERAAGDYPDETYERLAYDELREIALTQGTYLAVAADQRKNTSARQQVLESLLTVQRYGASPRAFALELSMLMEPLTSQAYVLDEVGDFTFAQTYTLEMLNALLGRDIYAGKALFPRLGRGLLSPGLFTDYFLTEYAPDIKQTLAGRDIATLSPDEQLRILNQYLVGTDGKLRPLGLFRLAAAWLTTADAEELRALADVVHEARKGNYR